MISIIIFKSHVEKPNYIPRIYEIKQKLYHDVVSKIHIWPYFQTEKWLTKIILSIIPKYSLCYDWVLSEIL